MVKFTEKNRKAISPIIATVLIIAITLIAAVAIGGFVFGLFGASSSTAQVQVINAALKSGAATTLTVTCASSAGGSNGYIQISNVGSANTVVTALSITYGGIQYSASLVGCTSTPVTAGQSLYLQFGGLPAMATSGQQFSGFIVTANGAQVVFTGAFS